MTFHRYKSEALRLASQHLDTHGVPPLHADILRQVAEAHGAKNWDTLLSEGPEGFWQKMLFRLRKPPALSAMVDWDQLLFQTPIFSMRFGISLDRFKQSAADIEESIVRNHILLVGESGKGALVLLENLLLQQMVRGGGMLVLDGMLDHRLASKLAQVAARTGRIDFKAWLEAPEPANLGLNELVLSNRCVYLADCAGQASVSTLGQQLVETLASTLADSLRAGGRVSGAPFLLVLPLCEGVVQALSPALLVQMASLGVTLVLRAQSLFDRVPPNMLANILAHTRTKVFFKPGDAEATRSTEVFLNSAVATEALPSKGAWELSVTMHPDWSWRLSRMKRGSALLLVDDCIRGIEVMPVNLKPEPQVCDLAREHPQDMQSSI